MKRATAGSRGIEGRLVEGGNGGVRVRGKAAFFAPEAKATTTTSTVSSSSTLPSWRRRQQQQHRDHDSNDNNNDGDISLLGSNENNKDNNNKEHHHGHETNRLWSLLLLSKKRRKFNGIKTRLLVWMQQKWYRQRMTQRQGQGGVHVVVIISLLLIMTTMIRFVHILKSPTKKTEFSILLLNLMINDRNNNNSSTTVVFQQPKLKRIFIPSRPEDIDYYVVLSKNETKSTTTKDQKEKVDKLASWYYYAFDDDALRNPLRNFNDDEFLNQHNPQKSKSNKRCRRTNWHRHLTIDCNKLHEFDLLNRFRTGHMYYLTTGGYREVYLTNITGYEAEYSLLGSKVAFKSVLWDTPDYKYDVEDMRTDAIVTEKLSSQNPTRIVDMYGYCGASSINEAMVHGDLYELAKNQIKKLPIEQQEDHDANKTGVGGDGSKARHDSDDHRNNNTPGVNSILSGKQKLQLALEMAESIQIMHSYKGGVIVHDDIKAGQFMVTKKKKKTRSKNVGSGDDDSMEYGVKLNDFNRAEILLFDTTNNEYCPYRNDRAGGNWRSPEEYKLKALDEKIDVYSLGSSLYSLMTGHKPFYHEYFNNTKLAYKDVKKKLKKGENDYLDPRYCNSSYGDRKVCEMINLCWEADPTKRIDIFGVVKFLKNATLYQKLEEEER